MSSPSATAPRSAPALYKHALESVFCYASLSDLVQITRVCHAWLAAAHSMAPIRASMVLPDATQLRTGVLARQISGLHVVLADSVSILPTLVLLRYCFTNLTQLSAEFALGHGEWSAHGACAAPASVFPVRLQVLSCTVLKSDTPAEINAMIASIGRLEQLATLRLHLPDTQRIRFTPLASLLLLRDFSLDSDGYSVLTDGQIDDLRSMHRLHHMSVHKLNGKLSELLRPPHALEWQELRVLREGLLLASDCRLLSSLPCLTTLDAWIGGDQLDFLLQLPKLTTLTLRLRSAMVPIAHTVATLSQSRQLTALSLTSGEFSDDDLCALLPHLPQLTSFSVSHGLSLHRLSFLAVPSLMANLQFFELCSCLSIPLSELHHLHGLRSLEELRLYRSFNQRMSPELEARYTPPTSHIPSLQYFSYDPPALRRADLVQ